MSHFQCLSWEFIRARPSHTDSLLSRILDSIAPSNISIPVSHWLRTCIVLKLTLTNGCVRLELARETELQRSTVSEIVDSLSAEGLIEEIGEGESTGGRRPTMLRLRTVGAIAIGVAITPTRTTVATSDLAGRIIAQEWSFTNPEPDRTLDNVIDCVRHFSDKNKDSIEAVGISIPGLVDPSTGSAIYVPYFNWRDL